ncbi:DUF4167 domain-containing protein [Aurantiacibacter gangjinensis]|uniref:Uncharacterized protein n=1 Tax=Aurantiacibacter gangjinensis TaxID=502682 RepID=A0A0G9MQY3_9SPHN|nr:DUF4167 domain-containing protein [Aurantiacibacter gangjinensis]APE27714.1 Eukaryotic translation initiation factor 3 subunit 10 [Aurantiacibacter gangjinensis]KLE31718.1 hypothetical protein AAW01_09415 [Aurantiacibacter gangjinensis]
MNNNRNNNRRRGRGNNRGGGGPQNQANRIDSRARGNAPQMLEKYKKLANDAALNDDRVQTEYYLQFADHYFRVIADNKAQKDEARAKRDAERGDNQSSDDDDDDGDDARQDRNRGRRGNRQRRDDRDGDDFDQGNEGASGDQEDDDNPFTKDTRKPKARKPRKARDAEEAVNDDGSLDPGLLPPAIARADDEGEEKPKRRTRTVRKPKDDGGEEALEAVS